MDIPKLARIKQDDENMEKLHVAARKGQVDHIRRLLSLGVPASIANKFGCTALHLACKHGQVNATRELAPISDLSGAWHGQKPLHLSVAANNMEVVQVLIEGAKQQSKQSFESFLNECDEFEVNEVGEHHRHLTGQTALHWCVGLGSSHLPMLQLLLSYGANPTSKDKLGETPIMRAIEFDNADAFELLTHPPSTGSAPPPPTDAPAEGEEAPAATTTTTTSSSSLRLDICDKAGRSSLHWAISYNRPEMAAALLRMGHEVAMEDQDKMTPMILAMRAAMPTVMEAILEVSDQFAVLSAPFHNGFIVQPERIEWFPFVAEGDPKKNETIKAFQRKLEAVNKANQPPPTADEGKKKKKKTEQPPMELAPSAPMRGHK